MAHIARHGMKARIATGSLMNNRIGRREFLRLAMIGGAVLSLQRRASAASGPSEATKSATASGSMGTRAAREFAEKPHGYIILPVAPTILARRVFSWNPMTDKRPAVIVRCRTADEARSIDFARRHYLERRREPVRPSRLLQRMGNVR